MPHRLRALAANTTKVSLVNSEDRGDRVDRENHVERRDRHERQRQRRRVRCAARRARRSGRGRRLSKDDDTADNLKIPGGRASHTTPASVPRPSPPALPPTPTDGVSARPLCEPGAEAIRSSRAGCNIGCNLGTTEDDPATRMSLYAPNRVPRTVMVGLGAGRSQVGPRLATCRNTERGWSPS